MLLDFILAIFILCFSWNGAEKNAIRYILREISLKEKL